MAVVVSTGNAPELLQTLFNRTINGYPGEQKEWQSWVEELNIDRYDWKVLELATIGLPEEIGELENLPTTSYNTYATKVIRPVKYGLAIQISYEAIRFNKYQADAPQLMRQFKEVFRLRENIQAASIINEGWNPAYPMLSGQPLFSPKQLVRGGSFANTFQPLVTLNTTTMEALAVMASRFLNTVGQPISTPEFETLIIPPELQFQAKVVLDSYLNPSNATNAINAFRSLNILKNVSINKFINPKYFAIRTSIPGAIKVTNMPLQTQDTEMVQNQSYFMAASTMYFFACYQTRAFLGAEQPLNIPVSSFQ